ncbi:MAG: CAP domain-containing protein [Sphingomicrobium sp.]
MRVEVIVAIFVLSVAPAVAQPNFATQFPQRILAAHNTARASVGAPPLIWDNDLGTAAGQYAAQMATTGLFEHSDRHARRGIGENLWMGSHGAYSPEVMVGGWVGEQRYFVPGIFPNNSANGNWLDVAHYTQLVWPATTRIGCALASNGRNDYLVCRYAPAGNIDGRWVGPNRGERG